MTTTSDIEHARFNMIEQQIRPWDVLDTNVLDLLFTVRREDFVPAQYRELAFVDMEIPLEHGATMLAPKIEARMLQALALKPTDRVLEIGTGSGYLTALLAKLAAHVYSVDIEPAFTHEAGIELQQHHIANVTLETGDASRGWNAHAPYDAIVLTGSTPLLPEAFQESLTIGGRLLAVVGDAPVMEARLITRTAEDAYETVGLFETSIAPLKNALHPSRFVF